MPIYKGSWYDDEGNPCFNDCYEKHDPFGGPRFCQRPHNTKRRTKPWMFLCQTEFGMIAKMWEDKLTPTERFYWSRMPVPVKNRMLEDAVVNGHLEYMNHNLPLQHAGRELHHHYKNYYPYSFLSMRLMEIDTDFDKLRLDVTYTSYYANPDNGTLHFRQVAPDNIDKPEAWRYARWIGSHDMETDKRDPDKQVDEFWLPLMYHAEPGEEVQIYLRISMMYTHIPPPVIDGVTTSVAPIFYKITA